MLSLLLGSYLVRVCCAADGNTAVTVQAILDPIRDNKTALGSIRAPLWVLSLEIRGTSNILWSCVVTLVACIYTALHLNVSNRQAARISSSSDAPMNSYPQAAVGAGRGISTNPVPPIEEFDLRYCYFVIMGGLRVYIKDIKPAGAPNDYFSLSADTVISLTRRGH
ncbi:hypothetical protein B0H67DRAFT_564960 [Lasiosphaeris hirsuta]|uniref:Uncharacterized protein n=1 Tax=Lasiosphaeris hirsuta TaxID=260670 RepID=A0AA40EDN3_9PEZI|nr:hypothetical protein B0H67DRAFT_564960 [Lasiosphaeris hirsuta]